MTLGSQLAELPIARQAGMTEVILDARLGSLESQECARESACARPDEAVAQGS